MTSINSNCICLALIVHLLLPQNHKVHKITRPPLSFYTLQRNCVTLSCVFLKLHYQTPHHAIKCQDYKKLTLAADWTSCFLLFFTAVTDCRRIKVISRSCTHLANRFLICSLQSSAYETLWRTKFSLHILTVNHHEYNLLLLLTQGRMDVLLTNLFSWTYYTLLMELLLFECQSW
jgi:hypothetical protein